MHRVWQESNPPLLIFPEFFSARCPSPHSHQPPRQQANAAEADTAAESADTAPRAATAPVSKPAVFLVEPRAIQPVQTHRQHLLPILLTNLQLHKYALPIPPLLAWLPLPQSCPDQESFLSSLGLSSLSRLTVSRFCRLCRFRRRCRFQHCPLCPNQHCFVSSSPDDFNPITVGLQSRQREPS